MREIFSDSTEKCPISEAMFEQERKWFERVILWCRESSTPARAKGFPPRLPFPKEGATSMDEEGCPNVALVKRSV